MKCELKYVQHDMIRILKTMPLIYPVMFFVIGCVIYACVWFLFSYAGIVVLGICAFVLFVASYYNEAKEYCRKSH
jgi:hypothetical protein